MAGWLNPSSVEKCFGTENDRFSTALLFRCPHPAKNESKETGREY
jgi:hypothetical protein